MGSELVGRRGVFVGLSGVAVSFGVMVICISSAVFVGATLISVVAPGKVNVGGEESVA